MIASLLAGPLGAVLVLGGACSSCSHSATATAPVEVSSPRTSAAAVPELAAADRSPRPRPRPREDSCGAGSLPRFTQKDLGEAGVPALLAAAAQRPVAVIRNDREVRLVKDCRLNGRPYAEIPGKLGQGQFRPASRLIFRADELEGACRSATHLVAAFAVNGPASAAAASAAGTTPTGQVEGILVPLPCPPVADPKASPGCVARGATGAERRGRAKALWARLPREEGTFGDVAQPLELYALVPDHFWGLSVGHWVKEPMLVDQGSWLAEQYELGKVVPPRGQEEWMVDVYAVNPALEPPTARLKEASRRAEPPNFYWNRQAHKVLRYPAFMECFPALVDPDVRPEVIF